MLFRSRGSLSIATRYQALGQATGGQTRGEKTFVYELLPGVLLGNYVQKEYNHITPLNMCRASSCSRTIEVSMRWNTIGMWNRDIPSKFSLATR
jgi:hypothetical protein